MVGICHPGKHRQPHLAADCRHCRAPLVAAADHSDVPSMYARLAIISQKLNDYGLQHNSSYPAMLSRMTGEPDPLPLRVFGDVMQPPRQYARGELRHYDASHR